MIWNNIQRLCGALLIIVGASLSLVVIGDDDLYNRIFAAIVGVVMLVLGLTLFFGRKQ